MVFGKHNLEIFSNVMRVVVIYHKGQKQLKEIALHLKGTLVRPPTYYKATASPGSLVAVTNPFVFLFVQPDRKVVEEWTTHRGNLFFDNFWQTIHDKISLGVKTCIKMQYCTHWFFCF